MNVVCKRVYSTKGIGNLERGETKRGERKRKTVKIIKRKRSKQFGEEANNRARPEIRLGNEIIL